MKIHSLLQLLENAPFDIKTIKKNVEYRRQHDDTDGLPLQNILIKFDEYGDAHLKFEFERQTPWLLFKAPENGGKSPRVHCALKILAEVMRFESLDKNKQTDDFLTLLEKMPFPPSITPLKSYIRADDLGNRLFQYDFQKTPQDFCGALFVYIAGDNDVHISTTITPLFAPSLRFRTYEGGGHSLMTRKALLLLAEAIHRDNSPQMELALQFKPIKICMSSKERNNCFQNERTHE